MIEKLLINKKLHIAIYVLFYLLMVVEYVNFVYAMYSFMHFDLESSLLSVTSGFAMFLLTGWMLFTLPEKEDITYAISLFISLFFCLPAIVMYQFGGIHPAIPLYAILFQFLLRLPILEVPAFRWRFRPKHPTLILLLLAGCMIVPFVLTYGIHLNLSVFSLSQEIYEVRAAAKAKGNLFTAYLFGPLSKVVLPILLVWGIWKKKYWISAIAILLMLSLFMMNPHKALFLSIFLVLLFCFFKNHTAKAGMMLYGLFFLVLATVILRLATGNILPESIFLRRMLFLPIEVCEFYFSFFDGNSIYLSHSVLGHFIAYPYANDPAFLIGDMMYDRSITSCNTGVIGDSFMNFGHFGVVVYLLLATIFIRTIQSFRMSHRFFGLTILFLFLLMNSAFLTILLTHGGIFFLLVALFFLKDTDKEEVTI